MPLRDPMPINEAFFRTLLEISRKMVETRDLETLLHYALKQALELLNAERGYLMLADSAGNLEFRIRMDRQGSIETEEVSKTVVDRVMEQKQPVLIYDAMTDPGLSHSESVQSLGLRSIMAAPLIVEGTVIGIIYLENRSNASVFHQKELEPLAFFANQAAVSIENARLNNMLEDRVRVRTHELENAMQHLERGWLDAVEANRIRTSILANVAHDIRSPIGMSLSTLQTIREGAFGALTPKQMLWLDRTIDSLNHAITLTSDIFDLSKAELDALQTNPEMVDMYRFMNHVVQLGEGIEWDDEVQFIADYPREMPSVYMDATRIQQVIFNLLSNAQKFTSQGQVMLYARVQPGSVLIGVRDTGKGLAPDQLEKVFERYHQADQDGRTRFRGTGLGLAICRELVALHGGRIWVESEEGRYSDFKFELPL